jgi:hypothetical protein
MAPIARQIAHLLSEKEDAVKSNKETPFTGPPMPKGEPAASKVKSPGLWTDAAGNQFSVRMDGDSLNISLLRKAGEEKPTVFTWKEDNPKYKQVMANLIRKLSIKEAAELATVLYTSGEPLYPELKEIKPMFESKADDHSFERTASEESDYKRVFETFFATQTKSIFGRDSNKSIDRFKVK